MERRIAVFLALVLGVAGPARGEDVQWKAAAPAKFAKPVSAKEESAAEESASPEPVLLAPTMVPVTDSPSPAPKSAPEPLQQPRKMPTFAAPARMTLPNSSAMRTLTLVSEGEAPPAEPPPTEPNSRFYVRAEYLLWFTKLGSAPPLVTTAGLPAGAILPPNFGQIGAPGTTILYGNGPIGDPFHMGGRFTAGAWLDCEQTCGLDASFFFLGRNTQSVVFSSPTFPVVLRPFIQINPPVAPNFQIVAFPPGFTQGGLAFPDQTGSVTVSMATGLFGAEFNARECLCGHHSCLGGTRIDLFAGFRYLDLDDRVSITENILIGANNVAGFPAGSIAIVNDRFSTHNQFYGGQVGANWEYWNNRWVIDGRASVALGGTHEVIMIDGSQRITPPGLPTQFFTGGLLALRSNIGRFTTGRFSFVPELTLNAGYMILPRVKVFAGYNFLLWTPVARAAGQIDPVLDVSQIPNFSAVPPPPVVPTRPIVPFAQSTFWAQGAQLGVEFKW